MAEANLDEMATQIEKWGTQLATLADHVASPGERFGVGNQEDLDDLRAKYATARARLDEFKTAGGARGQMSRSDIERAWNDFESALVRLTGSSPTGTPGDHYEDPPTP